MDNRWSPLAPEDPATKATPIKIMCTPRHVRFRDGDVAEYFPGQKSKLLFWSGIDREAVKDNLHKKYKKTSERASA